MAIVVKKLLSKEGRRLRSGESVEVFNETITVGDNNFGSHDFAFDKRGIKEFLITLGNLDAADLIDFELYNCADSVDTPPAFALSKYELFDLGTGTLGTISMQGFHTAFAHRWILLRLKRGTAGNDADCEIIVRTEKR